MQKRCYGDRKPTEEAGGRTARVDYKCQITHLNIRPKPSFYSDTSVNFYNRLQCRLFLHAMYFGRKMQINCNADKVVVKLCVEFNSSLLILMF